MTVNVEELRAEMRWESRKFIIQLLAALATSCLAGAAIATLVLHLTGRI